ncbi:hypothetical protein FACS1894216_22030 [Synergistales bacterium]|nr:hypothetical protein FACS1894216_22030 [Synergistales bacterium]
MSPPEKAVTIVRHLSMDEQFRFDYEQSEKRRRDLMAFMDEATEKGIAKGKAEGKFEMANAMARNLLKAGVSPEVVADSSGLSINEILALKN